MDPTTSAGDDQPTLALPTGEQCTACGAPLARDQRYCVACGERRGKPRLPFMDGRSRQATPAPPSAAPAPSGHARRAGGSAGATLVAGVATLVLAMGVGVLIGRSGGNGGGGGGRAAAPAVQVVTVAGGGGAAADTSTTSTGSSTGSKGKAKVRTLPRSKLPPPTVTLGQRGSGPGFRRGRFTGDFFGP